MIVIGEKENINLFFEALTQKDKIWMGRGADAEIEFEDESTAFINGYCKWSIGSALFKCAESMRCQAADGKRIWADIDDVDEFLTLFEACEKYKVKMEVFSQEKCKCFEEHYKYNDKPISAETIDTSQSVGFDWEFTLLKTKASKT